MNFEKYRIAYVVSSLKRVGPTNQTLNIIRYSGAVNNCVVITLFEEPEDTQLQEYKQHNIEVVSLRLTKKNILLKGVPMLSRELEKHDVDIVHSYGTFPDIVSSYACKRLRLKHVVTLRNFPTEDMPGRMNPVVGHIGARVVLFYLRKCRYIVCCSKTIEAKMRDTYHWDNLYSIQNGVDFTKYVPCDKEQARREFSVENGKFILISTGSMIPRKRISETVDAFLAAERQDAELWLLGDGALLSELKEKYAGYKQVRFWGNVPDVARYLSVADVFVSSSSSEGMPNAVLEALSCGVPVLLSDIPQHKEVLESVPGAGKMYQLGNELELANLISEVSDVARQEMQCAAKKIIDSDLTMEAMGGKYADFYEFIFS